MWVANEKCITGGYYYYPEFDTLTPKQIEAENDFLYLNYCKYRSLKNKAWYWKYIAIRNKLWTSNYGLIIWFVRRKRLDPQQWVDIFEDGLLHCITKYDYIRARFSTYCHNQFVYNIQSQQKRNRRHETAEYNKDYDKITDPDPVVDNLISNETKQILKELLSQLDIRTQEIIIRRFEYGETLEGIGKQTKLGKERVRQILEETFVKLKGLLNARVTV